MVAAPKAPLEGSLELEIHSVAFAQQPPPVKFLLSFTVIGRNRRGKELCKSVLEQWLDRLTILCAVAFEQIGDERPYDGADVLIERADDWLDYARLNSLLGSVTDQVVELGLGSHESEYPIEGQGHTACRRLQDGASAGFISRRRFITIPVRTGRTAGRPPEADVEFRKGARPGILKFARFGLRDGRRGGSAIAIDVEEGHPEPLASLRDLRCEVLRVGEHAGIVTMETMSRPWDPVSPAKATFPTM